VWISSYTFLFKNRHHVCEGINGFGLNSLFTDDFATDGIENHKNGRCDDKGSKHTPPKKKLPNHNEKQ